jgi:hypothetical protein
VRRFILIAIFVGQIFCLSPAMAADKSPYADLLPANAILKDSPDRLDPLVLSRSTLGVVPSSRYVARTARWQKWFGEKGDKGPGFAGILGLTRANNKLGADATDPKRFVDAALMQLRPRFGAVKIFDDLAAARDAGARYFIVLDFNQANPPGFFGPTGVHGWAGALLLDGSFRRVVEVAVEKKTKWFAAPLLGMANAEMMASAKSYDENFKVLLPAFTNALNTALTAHGSPMPTAPRGSPAAPIAVSALPAQARPAAPVDQAFVAELAAVPTAGALYAIGDQMAENGERAKASAAFRTILTRFPNDPLVAKAADRLSAAAR